MADRMKLLAGSGDESELLILGRGNYIYAYDLGGLVDVDLYLDNELIESHTLERFVVLNGRAYDKIIVRNKTNALNEVRMFTGVGDYSASQDNSTVKIDSISTTLNVVGKFLSVPDVLCVAGETTQAVVGHVDNLRVRVTNLDTNNVALRIGCHNLVAVNNGSPLLSAQTWEESTKLGVWLHNPSGEDYYVAVEVLRADN